MKKNWWIIAMILIISTNTTAEVTTGQITAPLTKIYDLVKAGVTLMALIMLTLTGFKYMTAGDNPLARESAKNTFAYIVAGLVIVWVAPLMVDYLTTPVPAA